VTYVTIRYTRFILLADPRRGFVALHELVGTLMQGVVITDGYADGWVVENNLVVGGQAHGITLYGARGCRVQNNTVVAHPDFVPDAGPWVRITDQTKTGQENFDNVIRNNLAQLLTPWEYDVSSTVEGNLEISLPADAFVDHVGLDFHLRAGSAAIDAGINAELTSEDLDGLPRIVGGSVDVGAFERQ
jgi:parallel beta-helix repeat protein